MYIGLVYLLYLYEDIEGFLYFFLTLVIILNIVEIQIVKMKSWLEKFHKSYKSKKGNLQVSEE